MRWICIVAIAILATMVSPHARSAQAADAGKARYSCPRTLPPVQPNGKPRKLDSDWPYARDPLGILLPDAGGKTTDVWHLPPELGPYGLTCTYGDKSTLNIPLPPTVRRCFDSTTVKLFCD